MMDDDTADLLLARNAAGGDRASFSALIERHYGYIFRIAYRLTGHRADAEDVAQEVCARLGRSIRDYRGGAAFTTWLHAITVNAVRDFGRKSARETAKVGAYGAEALAAGEGETRPDDDPVDAMWAAVRGLPPKQAEAVTLVYGEGMSHAAASDLMGCSEATVSWHIHEAKKRLRQIMSAGEA